MGEPNARESDTNNPKQRFSKQPEKKLTPYQFEVLKKIVENLLETVSYRNPGRNLGNLITGKNRVEFLKALRSLESDFGILAYDPKIKSGLFDRGGYRVNLEKAGELYYSYQKAQKA